jgi:TRAP-type C4-dicarboxylate transport system permease small subunit
MNNFLDVLFHWLKIFAASCLAAMIVMVFGNVVLRYAFNAGITVSEELSSWCLTWMTYTAGLVALRDHGHLGFDGLLTKFPLGVQRFMLVIGHLLMMAMMAMFLYGSWQQTMININNAAPASGISMGALYGIGIVFSVMAIVVLFGDMVGIITGKLSHTISSEAEEAMAAAEAEAAELADDVNKHKA